MILNTIRRFQSGSIYHDTVEMIDLSHPQGFVELPTMTTKKTGAGGGFGPDGCMYVCGGSTNGTDGLDVLECLDIPDAELSEQPPPPSSPDDSSSLSPPPPQDPEDILPPSSISPPPPLQEPKESLPSSPRVHSLIVFSEIIAFKQTQTGFDGS